MPGVNYVGGPTYLIVAEHEGLIRNLDRRRFEAVVIHLPTSQRDRVRDRIDACADQAVVLADSFEGAARQLACRRSITPSPVRWWRDRTRMFKQIAKRLPTAWFVFVEVEITSYIQIFLNRIAVFAPTLAERLILLSRMGRQEFISLAGCLDVLLDPPCFGSGVPLYETIHTGIPIVTFEGDFLRSRFVAGAYRLMGLEQPPVAYSVAGYVDRVVALITDPEGRAGLRRAIAERVRQGLYDCQYVVAAFADFALKAIAQSHGIDD
ncbi:MAG: hypothetical protein NTV57_17260 [Cyanobacteria bacterium]|nr:hypothetical protein [Cyanobacteriota bacterium]